MAVIEDSQEVQECAHLLYKKGQLCWQHHNRQLEQEYLLCMYTSADSGIAA